MKNYMDEARQLAAQCWCDDETKDREMDTALAEAVAKRISMWMDTAASFASGMEFYRNLLDETAKHLGPQVFVADDGTVMEDPLRLKVPELVRELKNMVWGPPTCNTEECG